MNEGGEVGRNPPRPKGLRRNVVREKRQKSERGTGLIQQGGRVLAEGKERAKARSDTRREGRKKYRRREGGPTNHL